VHRNVMESVKSFVVRPLTGERVDWKGPYWIPMRGGKRSALRSGTPRGGKPEDLVPTSLSRTKTRATPAVYVHERNLRLKRRKLEQVNCVNVKRIVDHPHIWGRDELMQKHLHCIFAPEVISHREEITLQFQNHQVRGRADNFITLTNCIDAAKILYIFFIFLLVTTQEPQATGKG